MAIENLNGWQRLGVVISTIIAVPSFLIGYSDNKSAYVYYEVPEAYQNLNGQEFTDKVYWDAHSKEDELKGCILNTTNVQPRDNSATSGDIDSKPKWTHATITCDKTTDRAVFDSKWYAIVPFLVVFGIGYVISWIVDGFRKSRKRVKGDV
jgi:hypothetical protein